MNKERLQKLKERAEQAVKVAAEIATLEAADPYCYRNSEQRFRTNNGESVLDSDLLKRCLAKGRLALIVENETLLESLLATEPETLQMNQMNEEKEVA